jgi:hypothetical protein
MHKGRTDEPKGDYGCQFGCQFRESGGTARLESGVARFTHIYIIAYSVYNVSFFLLLLLLLLLSSNQIIRKKKRVAKFLFKRLFSNKRFRLLPSDIRRVFSDFCPRVLPGKRGEKRTSERKKGRKKERKNK